MAETNKQHHDAMSTTDYSLTIHQILKNETKEKILKMFQQQIDYNRVDQNGDTVLHTILRNEKLMEKDIAEILTFLLIQGVDSRIKNAQEQAVLHLAVERRMAKIIDLLLKFKADIHTEDKNGNTIAHFFIEDEYQKCKLAALYPIMNTPENREITEKCTVAFLEFLMSKYVDFDRKNKLGQSAMHLALEYFLSHVLPTLLLYTREDKNFRLYELYSAASTLHVRESKYNDESLRILLERCVIINDKRSKVDDKSNCTVISETDRHKMIAVEKRLDYYFNNSQDEYFAMILYYELLSTCKMWSDEQTDFYLEILRNIITLDIDINKQELLKGIVVTAMEAKNIRVLEFLRENGADFTFTLECEKSLLHLLVEQSDSSTSNFFRKFCDFLINSGLDINVRNNRRQSALYIAVALDKPLMAKILIELGTDVNFQDEFMRTPLHEATYTNASLQLIELLLKSGANINAKDYNDETPLPLAVHNNNLAAVRLLIKHGASVTCQDEKLQTPLHRVKWGSQKEAEMVDLLLSNGANVNVKDCKEETALHRATVSDGESLSIELLVANGADVNAKNYLGNRPVHQIFQYRAWDENCERALEILVKNGAYVNARNNAGETALCYALLHRCTMRVHELLKYNANLNELGVQKLVPKVQEYLPMKILLEKYWIKLAVANLPLNEKYKLVKLQAVPQLLADRGNVIYVGNDGDQKYRNECLEEIEKLKDTSINDHKSLYDFMKMRSECRFAYLNYEKLKQVIESPLLKEEFPIYSYVVLASYYEALTRKSLSVAKEAFYELIQIQLPDSVDRIFDYLDDADLINIIEVTACLNLNESECKNSIIV